MERDPGEEQYEEQLREGGILPTSPLGLALRDLDDRIRKLEMATLYPLRAVEPDGEIGLP